MEPVDIVDVEPFQILDVEPIQIMDVEPAEILDVDLIQVVDAERVVIQSPPPLLPILPTVVNVVKTNDEETAPTVESVPIVAEMQEKDATLLEEVVVDDVNDNGSDAFSESSGVPKPMEVSALQDEESILTLETNVDETAATCRRSSRRGRTCYCCRRDGR